MKNKISHQKILVKNIYLLMECNKNLHNLR